MVEVTFTPSQRVKAILEGTRRQKTNEASSLRGRNNAPSHGQEALNMHLLGAAAEMAVASYLDLEQYVFADKNPVRGSSDLPGYIDVKCRSKHCYDLLIQLDDDPSKKFVLVTIQDRRIRIHGWTCGHDAMQVNWIRELVPGRPAYVVPREFLKPIQELKCLVDAALNEKTFG
jgi:hypothetical protein